MSGRRGVVSFTCCVRECECVEIHKVRVCGCVCEGRSAAGKEVREHEDVLTGCGVRAYGAERVRV